MEMREKKGDFIDVDKVDKNELWENILIGIRSRINLGHFLTYFKMTGILKLTHDKIFIATPYYPSQKWLEKNAIDVILRSCRKNIPDLKAVEIVVDNAFEFVTDKKKKVDVKKIANSKKKQVINKIKNKTLRNDLTLDNFIVGPENRLAHAAICAAASKPGESYNPIYIYGDVGLGKTHLLVGMGNEVQRNFMNKKILYITAEGFMNDFVHNVQGGKADAFQRKFLELDVFLIDDVQFLAHKEQTQIQLYVIFNMLYDARKQIVISGDCPPKELTQLHDRLRSRCEWGMMVDVQMPDFETRVAILQEKCQKRNIEITSDVLNFIAENCRDSVRELEGVLMQAIALYELENVSPTVQNIYPLIKNLKKKQEIKGIPSSSLESVKNSDDVIDFIVNYFKIDRARLVSNTRKKEIMRSRQIAMYIIKTEFDESLEKIGEFFGGKNHTTVRHAVKKIREEMKKNKNLLREINTLRREMGFRK